MKARTRNRLAALAARAQVAHDDARIDTLVALGPTAGAYDGSTPRMIEGRCPFDARQIGWNTRERRGTTIRSGKKGGLKFVPARDAEPVARVAAHSYGEDVHDTLLAPPPGFAAQVGLVVSPASLPRPEGS